MPDHKEKVLPEVEASQKKFYKDLEAERKLGSATYLRGVLNGVLKPKRAKMEAAKALLPYEQPKLAQVEAVVRNVEMTHEEWLEKIDGQTSDKSK